MGGVVRGAVVVSLRGEVVDQAACGVSPCGRLAHRTQVVLPGRTRSPGEYRRRYGCQCRIQLRREGLRAEDQVGLGGLDRGQVWAAAGAHARQLMHDCAQVGRLSGGAVRQRGPDDPRLQAQRTQGVELVTGKHDDALRLVGHLDGVGRHPRRVVGGPGRRPGIRPGRLRCTRLVWPALVAQNARSGDLGGAGDHRRRSRCGRAALMCNHCRWRLKSLPRRQRPAWVAYP